MRLLKRFPGRTFLVVPRQRVSLKKPIGPKYFLTQQKTSIIGIEPNGSVFQRASYGPQNPPLSIEEIDTFTSHGWRIRLTRAENEPKKMENWET